MGRILAIGAVAVAIVVGYLVLGPSAKEEANSKQGKNQSGGSEGAGDVQDEGTETLPPPRRMTVEEDKDKAATTASLSEAFATEDTDEASAKEHAEMIRTVVGALLPEDSEAAKMQELECRNQHCMITIGGEDSKSVATLVSALQDERGFAGKAESLMMSRDGELIKVYLRFAE